eukprot:gnl/TRDRNA2_/TRDRNA2_166810_c0_seq1.p1 gnl/TRDRNA2_/TRDRNA2_166810_c0~~gnl/TRDRNA2_/TRDRNA2_166810_c0_seq1.p1  ORF type:complete len:396 (-),score=46.14 gnl/TRDRNA2_/TRDRNA2_166810_c0_seq1:112-1299(-)
MASPTSASEELSSQLKAIIVKNAEHTAEACAALYLRHTQERSADDGAADSGVKVPSGLLSKDDGHSSSLERIDWSHGFYDSKLQHCCKKSDSSITSRSFRASLRASCRASFRASAMAKRGSSDYVSVMSKFQNLLPDDAEVESKQSDEEEEDELNYEFILRLAWHLRDVMAGITEGPKEVRRGSRLPRASVTSRRDLNMACILNTFSSVRSSSVDERRRATAIGMLGETGSEQLGSAQSRGRGHSSLSVELTANRSAISEPIKPLTPRVSRSAAAGTITYAAPREMLSANTSTAAAITTTKAPARPLSPAHSAKPLDTPKARRTENEGSVTSESNAGSNPSSPAERARAKNAELGRYLAELTAELQRASIITNDPGNGSGKDGLMNPSARLLGNH